MPGCLGADENVLARTAAWITLDGSHHHLADCSGMRTGQRGAAFPAEVPRPAGRRLVALDERLARRPSEVSRGDDAPCYVRGAVRSPANRAMAIADELEWSSDLVRHGPAKTASLYGHVPPLEHC